MTCDGALAAVISRVRAARLHVHAARLTMRTARLTVRAVRLTTRAARLTVRAAEMTIITCIYHYIYSYAALIKMCVLILTAWARGGLLHCVHNRWPKSVTDLSSLIDTSALWPSFVV